MLTPHLAQAQDHVVQLTARHLCGVVSCFVPGSAAAKAFADAATVPVAPAATIAIAIAIATGIDTSAANGATPKDGVQVGSPKGPIDATAVAKGGLAPPRRAHAVRVEANFYVGYVAAVCSATTVAAPAAAAAVAAVAAAGRRRRLSVLPHG